jgi:hypothetical protein
MLFTKNGHKCNASFRYLMVWFVAQELARLRHGAGRL